MGAECRLDSLDEYFLSGKPFYFSPRHLLRNQLARLKKDGCRRWSAWKSNGIYSASQKTT